MPLAARIIPVCSVAPRVTAACAVAACRAGLFAVVLFVAALLSAPLTV
jgi:hypothetical protein